jgi:histidyl-tRNA synthetase
VELFIALEERSSTALARAFGLLTQARGAGLSAQMDLAGRALKRQLAYADSIGAHYVAIVGGAETVLKDMQQGSQEPVGIDAVVHAVLRGQHAL